MCSGAPTVGPGEAGNDRFEGGDGNDRLCGGLGVDQLSAGAGSDALSSLDNGRDGGIACGSGADFLTLDRTDPADLDCERLAQDDAVRLPRSGVVSLPVACASACTGSLKLVQVPDNPVPTPEAFREKPPAVGKRVVARSRFSLRRRASRVRLRLPAQTTRALRRRAQTVVEAQLTLRVGRRTATIRRMFPITK